MMLIEEFKWYMRHTSVEVVDLNNLNCDCRESYNVLVKGNQKEIAECCRIFKLLGFQFYHSEDIIFILVPMELKELLSRVSEDILHVGNASLEVIPIDVAEKIIFTENKEPKIVYINRTILGTVSGMVVTHNWRKRFLEAGISVFFLEL